MSNSQLQTPIDVAGSGTGTGLKHVSLAHGGGGQLTDELIAGCLLPRLGNPLLNALLDSAMIPLPSDVGGGRLAMTIDSYVVQPWSFPGGDIGRLAVSGTVNDLAVAGAQPLGLALGLIITEGFAQRDLEAVVDSIASTAKEAAVHVVTGDTKVVGRGQGDGIYITTAGAGLAPADRKLHPGRVQPGDQLLINGPIGDHGLTVMLAREMPQVQSVLRSDAAPLNSLIESVFQAAGEAVTFMRDPTRSGVAAMVSDLARDTGLHVKLDEASIPVRREAQHAADMLGLDPLEIANEGKVVMVVKAGAVDAVLDAMRHHPLGGEAAVIGEVEDKRDGLCELVTTIGGRRIVQKPYGEQLPRIC